MGVFAIEMAKLFNDLSPQAVVPTFSLIGIAMIIGILVYRFRWRLLPVTILGVVLMFVGTYLGLLLPVPLYRLFVSDPQVQKIIQTADDPDLPEVHGIKATRADKTLHYFKSRAEQDPAYQAMAANVETAGSKSQAAWVYILLAYALAASVLPVWLLLQPRDYINSFQLYIGLGLLLLGFAIWRPEIIGPAMVPLEEVRAQGAPPVLPFIFITIACGAVSGFHNLVSSGTTARQIRRETDAHVIGYGAMLTEGLLAVLVIMACVAGLSRSEYQQQYSQWGGLTGRALGAFLAGAGNVIARPFEWMFPVQARPAVPVFCRNFIAVVVVSFAMTTLDSATRLLRYNVEELAKLAHLKPFQNRYLSSLVAVVAIGYFALMKIDGKPAGLTLWQLFGTTNQLLAVLGLLVASVYLYQLRRPVLYTALPMLVMMISVSWAMTLKLIEFFNTWRTKGDTTSLSLTVIGAALAAMSIWMIFEAIGAFVRTRQRHAAERVPATVPAEQLTRS